MIETKMLVIDTDKRQKCDRIVAELRYIRQRCTDEGKSYFFVGCPKTQTGQLSSSSPVFFPYPTREVERMRGSTSHPLAKFREENTWMVASGSSRERLQHRVFNNIDNTFPRSQDKQESPLKVNHQLERVHGEFDEQITTNNTDEEDADDERETDEETPGATRDVYPPAQLHYLTVSPEPLDTEVFISDPGGLLNDYNSQMSFERTALGTEESDYIDEDEISLSEALLLEPSNSDAVNSTSMPVLADDLSASLDEGGSAWRRVFKLLRSIHGWLGRCFGCISTRSRS
jgi:hypothetical protein